MADEEAVGEGSGAEGGDGAGKKKLPMMTIIVIVVVMLVEGVVLGGLFMVMGSGPQGAQAEELEDDPDAEGERQVELMLVSGKFQNTQQGAQAFLYDVTIYVIVREKHRVHMEGLTAEDEGGPVMGAVEINTARISEDISSIFARAQPSELNEPERQSLKRMIQAACNERFGTDPNSEDDDAYVVDVIISNWKRFSTDI